ncbi:hypothetical protein [Erythrobacter sp. CCH5-A1]|uniref:hypothetical protein n=1 Tax=Erythrobacter sp. CCH5-A1 TaxID=1768792 RepID=UPI00083529CE|nr:hypothetical protein [Erythrobacter sp. CCH5-A1]
MAGGALAGGLCVGILAMLLPGTEKSSAILATIAFGVAGMSLFVVVPATLVFGLPTAYAIGYFGLRGWRAFTVCLTGAMIAMVVAIWLLSQGEPYDLEALVLTTPFALGAAVVLWWRMTRA